MSRQFSEADHYRHAPTDDPNWQESWFTSWYDPSSGRAGYHHVDFQPARHRACVQSWVAADNVVVSRYQSLNIPIDDHAPDTFQLGPLGVQTVEPLRSFDLEVTDADEPTTLLYNARFTGFTEPHSLSKNLLSDYVSRGTGHYEVIGTLTGRSGAGAEFTGLAFHDHSWGPRDYTKLSTTYRWGHFLFGPDLYLVVYAMTNDAGRHHYGYVNEGGVVSPVAEVRTAVTIGDDGHTPLAATLHVCTADGREFELTGETAVASVSTHDGGHFATESYGTYRCGARVGAGHLAVRELTRPTAEHLAWLRRHDQGPYV